MIEYVHIICYYVFPCSSGWLLLMKSQLVLLHKLSWFKVILWQLRSTYTHQQMKGHFFLIKKIILQTHDMWPPSKDNCCPNQYSSFCWTENYWCVPWLQGFFFPTKNIMWPVPGPMNQVKVNVCVTLLHASKPRVTFVPHNHLCT